MDHEELIDHSIKEAEKVLGEDAVYLAHQVKGLVVVNLDDVHTIGEEEEIFQELLEVYRSAGGEELLELLTDRFETEGLNFPSL